jgi:hypothetical protein
MANWTLCNLYAGCRGIEWAQTDATNTSLSNYHKNRFGNAYAFTLEDVECLTITNQRISHQQAIAAPETVGSIKLRFEEQKNGENGEKKLFVRNNNKPHICFVENFMQIMIRHSKLSGIQNNPSASIETMKGNLPISQQQTSKFPFELPPQNCTILTQLQTKRSCKCGLVTHCESEPVQHFTQWDSMKWKSNTSFDGRVMHL